MLKKIFLGIRDRFYSTETFAGIYLMCASLIAAYVILYHPEHMIHMPLLICAFLFGYGLYLTVINRIKQKGILNDRVAQFMAKKNGWVQEPVKRVRHVAKTTPRKK